LTVTALPSGGARFLFTAPGDDGSEGQATQYGIRYSATPLTVATWDTAEVVEDVTAPKLQGEAERITIPVLPEGTWHFGVKTADEVPNWSALSNVVSATLAIADTIPPRSISDLVGVPTSTTRIELTWTAPGDDGTVGRAIQYDLRYATSTITEETWDAASGVQNEPPPAISGIDESFEVTNLTPATLYFFAIKTRDDASNWSGVSNVLSVTTLSNVDPPAAVTDLAVTLVTTARLSVSWTAPGNDGTVGTASEYDIRYALSEVTEDTWDAAIAVDGEPVPGEAGTNEAFTISGLDPLTMYSVALKTSDGSVWSAQSNVASGTTVNGPVRLTTSPRNNAESPHWSPDGQRILFEANWTTLFQFQLHALRLGGTPEQWTQDPNFARYGAWSPNGGQISFMTHRYPGEYEGGPSGLWVAGAAPYSSWNLVAEHGDVEWVYNSSWSPNGTQIAYSVVVQRRPIILSQIRIASRDGGTSQLLVGHLSNNHAPAWSPNGSTIAFGSDRTGNFDIWTVSTTGSDLDQLTSDSGGDFSPSWSPDGTQIVFTSNRSGNLDLWIMSSTGDNPTQLTFDPATDGSAAWSPDGREIAFTSDRSGAYEIWVMPVPSK
jgi:hypothetical protein